MNDPHEERASAAGAPLERTVGPPPEAPPGRTRLPSGIPGLDVVLGGGLLSGGVYLLAGGSTLYGLRRPKLAAPDQPAEDVIEGEYVEVKDRR